MHFDDRLDTVLRQPVRGREIARVQYVQLLDLLGKTEAGQAGSALDPAYERLSALTAELTAPDREKLLRGSGIKLRNPALVAFLAEDDTAIASAAIAAAELEEQQWLDLVPALPVAALAIAASVIVTRPALLAGFATQFYRRTGLLPRLMTRIRRAAQSLRAFSHPQTLSFAAALGLVGWLAEGYAFHLLLGWFGADLGFWKAVMIFVFATLAGGLTGAPGGVGGAEAAMIALLYMDGIGAEIAVPATAIIRVTTLWFAILIGLAIFPQAEAKSKGTP